MWQLKNESSKVTGAKTPSGSGAGEMRASFIRTSWRNGIAPRPAIHQEMRVWVRRPAIHQEMRVWVRIPGAVQKKKKKKKEEEKDDNRETPGSHDLGVACPPYSVRSSGQKHLLQGGFFFSEDPLLCYLAPQ